MNFRRSYFSKEEYSFRLEVFSKTLKRIEKLNSDPNDMAEYGINKFSDFTEEEFKSLKGLNFYNMPDSDESEELEKFTAPE